MTIFSLALMFVGLTLTFRSFLELRAIAAERRAAQQSGQ